MKYIFQKRELALLTSIFCMVNLSAQVLIEEHSDITFSYSTTDGEWGTSVRYGDFGNPENQATLDEATLTARDLPTPPNVVDFYGSPLYGDRPTQPSSSVFDFTGVPDGDPLWTLPQTDRGYCWPGFRVDQVPGTLRAYVPSDPRQTASASWVKIELVDMAYRGTSVDPHFSLWQSQGGIIPWMASSDGIDSDDVFYVWENNHVHITWGFSALGLYRLAFRPSAILDSTGETVVGEPEWVSCAIGTKAVWTASYYAGDDLFEEAVSGDASDSDKDGIELLLEYAFNLNPVVGDFKVLEPSTGTSGLPVTRLMPDGLNSALQTEYIRRKASTNPQISYFAEFKSDLSPGEWTVQTTETVSSIDDEWERVVVNDAVNTADSVQRFARVRVEVQENISY